ncbi:apolipo protein O-domain-containing protein [Phlebopus sp. FC_14]|nr:apolipo protein O-domain-containing protein [Phlebopus sp. FC_14]
MTLAGAAGAVAVENGANEEQHGSADASSQSSGEPSELSIYPKPTPTLVLLDTSSPLELRIGQVRRELSGYYNGARTQVQGVVDQWINIEGMVESRIKSFRDPTEPLNPGLLYTGVSALTASILVRSRSLPARFLLPPLSFLGAFVYFLPRTAGRVGDWAEELEGRYVPRVGEVRRTSIAHSGMALAMLREKTKEGKDSLNRGARTVVENIERGTGLKLEDALGWTKESNDKSSSSNEGKKTGHRLSEKARRATLTARKLWPVQVFLNKLSS